jgi:hypothetical protein
MPCSLTPEVSSPPAHARWSGWCLRAFGHPRPPRKSVLTGLNRFSHTAYGLHPPCLRLTHAVAVVSPRLGMECVGSTLFQSHLQRQATVRFVAHPKPTVAQYTRHFRYLQAAKFTKKSGPYWEVPRPEVMVMLDNFPEKSGSRGDHRVRDSLKRHDLCLVSFPKRLFLGRVACSSCSLTVALLP